MADIRTLEWIPKYINIEVNDQPRQRIDASYWNGLWNRVIQQGDNNTAGIADIKNTWDAFVVDTKEYIDQILEGLNGFATEDYVDEAIANIEGIPEEKLNEILESLNGFATEDYVDEAIANIGGITEEKLKEYVDSKYATQTYVDNIINNLPLSEESLDATIEKITSGKFLPLTGGILAGDLEGTSGAFSKSLTVGGENVSVEGHTHSGYASSEHTHEYLPLTGGTLAGGLNAYSFVTGGAINGNTVTSESTTTVKGALEAKGGNVEIWGTNSVKTPYIDFNYASSAPDYTSRIIENAAGTLTCEKNFNVGGSLTVDDKAVSLSGHTHSYLPLSGGTLTGALKVNSTVTATKFTGKLDGDLYAGGTLVATVSDDSTGVLYSRADQNGALGTTSHRWYSINAMILRTYDETTTSNGVDARIYSNRIYRYSSSSERYKHDITPIEDPEIAPERLYDAEVVQFKYNDGYLMEGDTRNGTLIPGFIVEKLAEVYPIAVDYNEDGSPEMWNANILIPSILKLVQDQHKEIEQLKEKLVN